MDTFTKQILVPVFKVGISLLGAQIHANMWAILKLNISFCVCVLSLTSCRTQKVMHFKQSWLRSDYSWKSSLIMVLSICQASNLQKYFYQG